MLGYTKLENKFIAKLEILGKNNQERDVYDSDYALYRCRTIKVLDIYHMDNIDFKSDHLYDIQHKNKFSVGRIIQLTDYDDNLNMEGKGVEYFITEDAAYWRAFEKSPKYTGEAKGYTKNGKKHFHYNYLDGKKHGIQMEWYIDDKNNLKFEANYLYDELNGNYTKYYENGNVYISRFYVKYKKNGQENIYNQDGIRMKRFYYENGKKEGIQKIYYPSGNLKKLLYYKNGKKDGKQFLYEDNENIIIKIKLIFKEGKLIQKEEFLNEEKEEFQDCIEFVKQPCIVKDSYIVEEEIKTNKCNELYFLTGLGICCLIYVLLTL